MNVLSLFDGMSCGMVALQRSGLSVENYYASDSGARSSISKFLIAFDIADQVDGHRPVFKIKTNGENL